MYLFREFMNQRGRRLLKVETLGDCLGKVTNFGYNQPFYCIHYPDTEVVTAASENV